MIIDHASREPFDDRDDPPPMGHGTPPGTPPTDDAPPTSSPPFDFRPLTWAAVILEGNQRSGIFRAASFGEIVRMKFDLRERPGDDWCRSVLGGLPYVTTLPGGTTFKVQTG